MKELKIYHIDKILNQLKLVSAYPNVDYDFLKKEKIYKEIKGHYSNVKFLWNLIWQIQFRF